MATQGSKSVPIKGLTDKRNITLNFVVSLSGEFFPLQIIYGGKTNACHPRGITFPKGFCVSHNIKHRSNEDETIKLLDEVVHPYIKKKRIELELPKTQKALMIWDVFKGQMTVRVKDKLRAKCICSARVLLLEVLNHAAKRISATLTTYQHFCRPMSPLLLYLVASLNSSFSCLASLLCADRSIETEPCAV